MESIQLSHLLLSELRGETPVSLPIKKWCDDQSARYEEIVADLGRMHPGYGPSTDMHVDYDNVDFDRFYMRLPNTPYAYNEVSPNNDLMIPTPVKETFGYPELSNDASNVVEFKRGRRSAPTQEPTYRKVDLSALQSPKDKEAYLAGKIIDQENPLGTRNRFKLTVDELVRTKGLNMSASDKDGKWYASIVKQVKRSWNLSRAYNAVSPHFPNGFPEPFDAFAEKIVRRKLIAARIPKEAIDAFLTRLRNFLKPIDGPAIN